MALVPTGMPVITKAAPAVVETPLTETQCIHEYCDVVMHAHALEYPNSSPWEGCHYGRPGYCGGACDPEIKGGKALFLERSKARGL